MKDIALLWDNNNSSSDLVIENNDLKYEEGLRTAVILSLFCNQRANIDDEGLDDVNDRQGWWGDALETNGDQIGSKLWLLRRQKITNKLLTKIKEAIEDSLEWMLTDGIVASFEVTVEASEENKDQIFTEIKINKNDDTTSIIKFEDLWTAEVNNV